jgi:hypothetical protein
VGKRKQTIFNKCWFDITTGNRTFSHASRLAAGYSGMGADWQQDIQAWEQTGSRIFRLVSTLAAGYSGT